MASGCPVIPSDSGNIPRVVGEAGIVFPEDDPRELAARIDAILGDPAVRHQLRRRAIERVEREFEWTVRARQMTSLFHSALSDALQ
jgi:glycosyltransferase involved in cell wall biosynthesis